MPRLHLVTGHRVINRSDDPFLLYLGHDADQAKQAQDAAIAAGHVLIAERYNPTGPVTRYGDKASLLPLPTAEPLKPLIPVELGEGEGMTIVHVETEVAAAAEADLKAAQEKLSAPATGPAQGDLLEPPSPPPKKKA